MLAKKLGVKLNWQDVVWPIIGALRGQANIIFVETISEYAIPTEDQADDCVKPEGSRKSTFSIGFCICALGHSPRPSLSCSVADAENYQSNSPGRLFSYETPFL